MNLAIVSLSAQGAVVAQRILDSLGDANSRLFLHEKANWDGDAARFSRLLDLTGELFESCRRLVYIAPCGAVIRAIAPYLKHKTTDPAVVVVDVGARYAISLLSGHEGGANRLALEVANVLGCEPVITTTTEAAKDIVVGVGCRRGASTEAIIRAVRVTLENAGLPIERVRFLASADLKKDEIGLLEAAKQLNLPLRFISAEEIRCSGAIFAESEFVKKAVNLPAVAEPSALIAGKRTELIVKKTILGQVTIAVARERIA